MQGTAERVLRFIQHRRLRVERRSCVLRRVSTGGHCSHPRRLLGGHARLWRFALGEVHCVRLVRGLGDGVSLALTADSRSANVAATTFRRSPATLTASSSASASTTATSAAADTPSSAFAISDLSAVTALLAKTISVFLHGGHLGFYVLDGFARCRRLLQRLLARLVELVELERL